MLTIYSPKSFRAQRASWRAVIQLNVVRSFHSILDAITRAERLQQDPSGSPKSDLPPLTAELLAIKSRLEVLVEVEKSLVRRLTTAGSGEVEATHLRSILLKDGRVSPEKTALKEVAINSATPWKSAFIRLMKSEHRESFDSVDGVNWDDPEDPGTILTSCSQDMMTLWASPVVRRILEKQRVRPEDLSGL